MKTLILISLAMLATLSALAQDPPSEPPQAPPPAALIAQARAIGAFLNRPIIGDAYNYSSEMKLYSTQLDWRLSWKYNMKDIIVNIEDNTFYLKAYNDDDSFDSDENCRAASLPQNITSAQAKQTVIAFNAYLNIAGDWRIDAPYSVESTNLARKWYVHSYLYVQGYRSLKEGLYGCVSPYSGVLTSWTRCLPLSYPTPTQPFIPLMQAQQIATNLAGEPVQSTTENNGPEWTPIESNFPFCRLMYCFSLVSLANSQTSNILIYIDAQSGDYFSYDNIEASTKSAHEGKLAKRLIPSPRYALLGEIGLDSSFAPLTKALAKGNIYKEKLPTTKPLSMSKRRGKKEFSFLLYANKNCLAWQDKPNHWTGVKLPKKETNALMKWFLEELSKAAINGGKEK